MSTYKVVGVCAVAGVEPGGVVTGEQLEAAKANVAALMGHHLESVPSDPEPNSAEAKPAPKKRAAGRGQ